MAPAVHVWCAEGLAPDVDSSEPWCCNAPPERKAMKHAEILKVVDIQKVDESSAGKALLVRRQKPSHLIRIRMILNT